MRLNDLDLLKDNSKLVKSINSTLLRLYLNLLYFYESDYFINHGMPDHRFEKYLKLTSDLQTLKGFANSISIFPEYINTSKINHNTDYYMTASYIYNENSELYEEIRETVTTLNLCERFEAYYYKSKDFVDIYTQSDGFYKMIAGDSSPI